MENPNKSKNNRPQLQCLCAGEALIDLVADATGKLTPCLGGAVYNLARALALQGIQVGYVNPLSEDAFGRQLSAGLTAAQVRVLETNPCSAPTSLAVVQLDDAGKAAYTFYREAIADRQTSSEKLIALSAKVHASLVCTGCLALDPRDADTYLPWLAAQKLAGKTVAIDVNVRAAVMKDHTAYKANIHEALQYADIIKASDDDLAFLEMSAADLLAQTSAKIFLLTLGSQGAQLLTQAGICLTSRAPSGLQVVDTVGAGDCFFAGFLAHWLRMPADLQAALDHAVRSASISVTRQGCQPPTWVEVTSFTTK